MEFKDYYKVLGLERNAAQDAIKPAWERAANRDKSSAHRPIGMQASSSQVPKVQEQSSATSLKRYLEKCGKANRPRPAGPHSTREEKITTQKSSSTFKIRLMVRHARSRCAFLK